MKKLGTTNALLQKVSSQLKGERVNKDEEDDLNAYLKSLTQKTVQQKKTVNFEDVGDISISSELESTSQKKGPVLVSNSKFLKKATDSKLVKDSTNVPKSKFLRKPQVSSASPVPTVSSQARPTTSRGPVQQQAQTGRVGTQQTASLDRAAALSNKIAQRSSLAQRSNLARKSLTLESDSDETFTTPRTLTPQDLGQVVSVSSDSIKIGRDGGKFMKKKPADPSPERPVEFKPEPGGKKSPVPKKQDLRFSTKDQIRKGSPFLLKSSQKYSTDVILSSEEESLAEFITGLEADSSEDAKIKEYMKNVRTSRDQKKRVLPSPSKQSSPPPFKRTPSPDSKPPAVRRTPSPLTPRRTTSPKVSRRSPSPGYRRSRSRSSDDSIISESLVSEVIQEKEEEDQSASSEDGFKINLLDADSLEPVIFEIETPKKEKEKKTVKLPEEHKSREKNRRNKTAKNDKNRQDKIGKNDTKKKKDIKPDDDIFGSFGLHTVDELLGGIGNLDEVVSEASEVKTQSESSEIRTEREEIPVFSRKTKHDLDSVTEIVSEIKSKRKDSYTEDFDSSISERIGVSSKVTRVQSASEIRTRYSSEGTGDEYTADFPSDTESIATVSKTSDVSERTISDSFTSYDKSYTYMPSSPQPDKRQVIIKDMKSVEIQTSEPGLSFRWDNRYSGMAMYGSQVGLDFVDPTPIVTHVISPDSLEALTAYSPSMLALHDMLKQQLNLTRQFVQSQQYMYRSFISNIDPSHKYTTLEETKQYIKKNKKKRLTFKEALKMVDAEMNR